MLQISMSSSALWLCIILLIGSGMAADLPFVFSEKTSGAADYTAAQLESIHSSSPELSGVPSISAPRDDEILEFSVTGGGTAPAEKSDKNVGDLKRALNAKVEPDNARVHEEAVALALKYPGDLTIDQICSIYSYLKNGDSSKKGWGYVRDPRGIDYFMSANESLKIGDKAGRVGGGDCDDFAILMAALVESIGGTTRIVLAHNNSTGGHAYVEVYLGQLNSTNHQTEDILDYLKQKYKTDKIYTHIETDTKDVWLNLDWGEDEKGDSHPGGPYYQGVRHIVLCIRDRYGKTPLKPPESAILQKPPAPKDIKPGSNDAQSLVGQGNILFNQGKYEEALLALDEALNIDPGLATAWASRAGTLINLGRNEEALQAAENAISLDSQYSVAWYNKGAALFYMGKYEEAVPALDKAIELNPNYALAWITKAGAIVNLGRNDEGLLASEEAIRLNPRSAKAWNNKGAALKGLGRYDEAIACFDKAIELDPNYALAWNNRGYALNALGRSAEANAAFARARDLGYKG
jgi:tetratricopeptide (TPR) repeat protein